MFPEPSPCPRGCNNDDNVDPEWPSGLSYLQFYCDLVSCLNKAQTIRLKKNSHEESKRIQRENLNRRDLIFIYRITLYTNAEDPNIRVKKQILKLGKHHSFPHPLWSIFKLFSCNKPLHSKFFTYVSAAKVMTALTLEQLLLCHIPSTHHVDTWHAHSTTAPLKLLFKCWHSSLMSIIM